MHEAQPPEPPPLPAERRSPKKSWQFSMRTMLIGMTSFAILSGAMVLTSGAYIFHMVIGVIWLALSGLLATGLVFARGDQRAFCIGATVVFLSTWTRTGGGFLNQVVNFIEMLTGSVGLPQMSIFAESGLKYLVLFVMAVANGYLCVHARRYFESHATE